MCLLVDTSIHKKHWWSRFPKPIVLKENLIVYKMVGRFYGQWRTPYMMHFIPPIGKRMIATFGKNYNHYYKTFEINEGIHAYQTLKFSGEIAGFKCIRCMIPKGTNIYYGLNDDIVSEELIILE